MWLPNMEVGGRMMLGEWNLMTGTGGINTMIPGHGDIVILGNGTEGHTGTENAMNEIGTGDPEHGNLPLITTGIAVIENGDMTEEGWIHRRTIDIGNSPNTPDGILDHHHPHDAEVHVFHHCKTG
jgi:hypothetical protein